MNENQRLVGEMKTPLKSLLNFKVYFRVAQLLRDPLVDRVYRKHRKPLERIFAFYGGQDGDMSISIDEFSLMLKQLGIMPQYLEQDEVVQLFLCIQSDEIGDDEGAAEMDYTEFLEAIAAITTFTIPNPYMGLDQRLDMFITDTLLVKAKQVKKLPPKFARAHVAGEEASAGEAVELTFDKIEDETSERDRTLKVMQQLGAEAEVKKAQEALDKYGDKFA